MGAANIKEKIHPKYIAYDFYYCHVILNGIQKRFCFCYLVNFFNGHVVFLFFTLANAFLHYPQKPVYYLLIEESVKIHFELNNLLLQCFSPLVFGFSIVFSLSIQIKCVCFDMNRSSQVEIFTALLDK